jgi:cytochrome P450
LTHHADICNELYQLARDCNGTNVALALSGVPVLLIQRHEEADYVLRHNATNYDKNMAWFRQALGASRFSEDGEAWRVRREITHAHFTHFDRDLTCRSARQHARHAIARMCDDSAGGAPTLDDDIPRHLAASVLVETFLGATYEDAGIDMGRIAALMEYGSAFAFVPPGANRQDLSAGLRELLGLRRQVLKDMLNVRDGGLPPSPLLKALLAADADPRSNVVLEHELVTFFAAGAETSAAALGWALYLLARYPQVQSQLRETAGELGLDSADWGWAELSRFDALADFLSETLRLFPPTPIVSRVARDNDQIGDQAVNAGEKVIISFIGVQHDARLRASPWELQLPGEKRTGKGGGTATAFSAGPRVCGGKQFAMVELMAALLECLLSATFTLTSDAPPRYHWKSQMLREGGQPVRVTHLPTSRGGLSLPPNGAAT